MKKISHKNICHNGSVQIHVDPPPITLIKSNLDLKMERDYMKTKLHRSPMSEKLDRYKFQMALFDNGETE